MQIKYNIVDGDFLKYLTLIKTINKIWGQELKDYHATLNKEPEYLIDKLRKKNKVNKILYNKQIELKQKNNKCLIKWDIEFPEEELNWKHILTTPIHSTIDTKLREYQYKYIMNLVPNNDYLHKCKITNSRLCDFCSMAPETQKHLFWECPITQNFWSNLQNFINTKHIQTNIMQYRVISLGVKKNNNNTNINLINFLLILAKYYISYCKYDRKIPEIASFKNYLLRRILIEKIIATQKDKLDVFEAKWNEFLQLC